MKASHFVFFFFWFCCSATAATVNRCCSDESEFLLWNNTCSDGERPLLKCDYGYFHMNPEEDPDEFWVVNGTTMLHDGYRLHEYCMTSMRRESSPDPQVIALVCFTWELDSAEWAYMIIMIISVPFLIATILVYAMVPVLRDINGKCIIGYVASLTLSYTSFITRSFVPELGVELCSLRGAVLYFSTISTFSWLNLVTFNVWRSVRNKVFQMCEKKLFRIYLCWSLGVPLLLCSIVLLLDLIPGSHLKGHFSMFDCWFTDSWGFWILFYLPMTVLIILNVGMFIHCCWILWRGYRDPTQSRIRFLRFKCLLTLRLFALSGVPWLFDVISTSLEDVVELQYVWFVFDCINSGQGIILFLLLVVCHKRVLRAIHQHKLFGIKWPDSWGEYEADSVVVSEIDKVALEQMKQTA